MLYAVLKTSHTEIEVTWHIGEKIPHVKPFESVVSVQADSDELEYIRGHISGIPNSHRRVVVWHGAFADFILRNL